jgi:hypothetical protein
MRMPLDTRVGVPSFRKGRCITQIKRQHAKIIGVSFKATLFHLVPPTTQIKFTGSDVRRSNVCTCLQIHRVSEGLFQESKVNSRVMRLDQTSKEDIAIICPGLGSK